jgi:hypothetical protein
MPMNKEQIEHLIIVADNAIEKLMKKREEVYSEIEEYANSLLHSGELTAETRVEMHKIIKMMTISQNQIFEKALTALVAFRDRQKGRVIC